MECKLISDITATETALMFRSVDELDHIKKSGGLVTKYDQDKLIAFAICKQLSGKYVEVGCLYVLPEYRGNGIGTQVFLQALELAGDKNVVVRTKEKSLKKLFLKNGFRYAGISDYPALFAYTIDRMSNFARFAKFIKSTFSDSNLFVKERL